MNTEHNDSCATPGVTNPTKLKLSDIVASANVAALLTQQELTVFGRLAVEGYRVDLDSRKEWEERHEKAIKLALQVSEAKTFPWENCSNVKFPLLTIAALQFLARISVMTKGRNLVKVTGIGADLDGQKSARAKRVGYHLSNQLTEEDTNWVDQDEQAKFSAALVGSGFKKTYHDGVKGCNISEHVPAMNFVVDYFCKDIDKANRATHLLSLSDNAIQERVRRGLFLKMSDHSPGAVSPSLLQIASDETAGIRRPADSSGKMYEVLEQHCWLDLDGDGYAEPYIVFVRFDTAQVLRIVAKFFDEGDVYRANDPQIRALNNKLLTLQVEGGDTLAEQGKLEQQIDKLETAANNHIVRIEPVLYFTKYLFVPSPDGGFYGLGLGALLGPMNESVNTLVNQLIDGGTMANTAGGFLGRGVKMKGGKMSFDPFEWKPVDSTGDDLRKSIFPLPVREPSAVLFQLLGMLVSYSEKISGATDIMTGVSPGQNTPAETSRNTVEQGLMLFSGIYGRMYRGLKAEILKFYELNRLYLSSSRTFAEITSGPNAVLAPEDYDHGGLRVMPSASPAAVSQAQVRERATMLLQVSASAPGFNTYKVMRDFLEAHDYDDIDQIYPDPAGPNAIPQGQDPKAAIAAQELAFKAQVHKDEMQLAIATLRIEANLTQAKIVKLQADATQSLANAEGEETYKQIALINTQVAAQKAQHSGLMSAIAALQKNSELKIKAQSAGVKADVVDTSGAAGMVAQPNDGQVPPAPEKAEAGNDGGLGM